MDRNHLEHERRSAGRFWKSSAGLVLIGILIGVWLTLIYQQRAYVFSATGALVAFLFLCLATHSFIRGGHGSHGGGASDKDRREQL